MPFTARITGAALVVAALATTAATVAATPDPGVSQAGRPTSTTLLSRALDGGTPNGPSTNAVISGDRRFARIVAFESEASDLVRGDTNGQKDVFAIERAGSFANNGSVWTPGDTVLVSRGLGGAPADGPSFGAAVSGDFRHAGACVAFVSRASNLAEGDTNGVADAFLVKRPGAAPERVSLAPSGDQFTTDVDEVTVSGDCSRVSFVTGGLLYTRVGSRTTQVRAPGTSSKPSYAAGNSNALVWGARGGVYLSSNGTARGKLVARGGANPAFNDLKRRTLAYEKRRGARVQIFYRDLGKRETIISRRGRRNGNGNSADPVIGNSGFYVMFDSDASNLGVNAAGQTGDRNGLTDSYLYSDARKLTLVQSVEQTGVPLPGGGANPSMSYYANYIVFDSPAPLGAATGSHQIVMRYLGPV
jgi:hypothetical protein